MQIEKLTVGPVATNCYLLSDGTNAGPVLVIDPGADAPDILKALRGRPVCAYLLTHGHFDHTGALSGLPKAPVCLHTLDAAMLNDPALNAGFLIGDTLPRPAADTVWDRDGLVPLSGFPCKVHALHTPGHTPGSCTFEIDNVLFTGDTLFRQGFGRTDLPGGSQEDLRNSLRKLLRLPGDLRVLPGHGPETTLEKERALF